MKHGRPRALQGWIFGVLAAGLIVLAGWVVVWWDGRAVRSEDREVPAGPARVGTAAPPSGRMTVTGAVNAALGPAPRLTNKALSLPAPREALRSEPEGRLPGPFLSRPVTNLVEAQLALALRGISPGSIDGVEGYQTRSALRAFQARHGLPVTGQLDAGTRSELRLLEPPLISYEITETDLGRIRPVPPTWLGKSQVQGLEYESVLELIAEKSWSHPNLIRRLNPQVAWTNVAAGTAVWLPNARGMAVGGKAAFVRIEVTARVLRAYDSQSNLLVHFPCSIARRVEKRPFGELRVAVVAEDPNYVFNPEIFPESAEGRRLGRRLTIPPGPNNPVGVAWIGLDRPGYGIHGTPRPEDVGRTESHGCFRLANWNARHLLRLVWIGMPVHVEH